MLAHNPLDDAGDLQVRVDGDIHPGQVAVDFERRDKLLQIGDCHSASIPAYS